MVGYMNNLMNSYLAARYFETSSLWFRIKLNRKYNETHSYELQLGTVRII